MTFLFFKWLHIVAVISWMAGILYLYRLFVYHAENLGKAEIHNLLTVMESRLMKYITRPAMIVTWIAGFAMVFLNPSIAAGHWFSTKFILVFILTFSSEKGGGYVRKFAKHGMEQNASELLPSSKKFRIYNEVPTILMLIIVALVVFKPF
jgi:putative membrane protein